MRKLMFIVVALLMLAAPTPVAAQPIPDRTLFSVFYWWYPYYGGQWVDARGAYHPIEHNAAYLSLDKTALHPLLDPIPYLRSEERPDGDETYGAATVWFYNSFRRAAQAGIDVLILPVRPDLTMWELALSQMHTAQATLRGQGLPYPLLSFMADGVEYWDTASPDTGDLTEYGQDYRVIFFGLQRTLLHEQDAREFYYQWRGQWVVFFYRVEGGKGKFVASNWWLNRLRKDIEQTTGVELYAVLDEMWCGYQYGGRDMYTCDADNWMLYGANVQGKTFSKYQSYPLIANITVGFDGRKPSGFRTNTQVLERSFEAYTARWADAARANWIIVETFNFVEEDSHIDRTRKWGEQYIGLTSALKGRWVSVHTP